MNLCIGQIKVVHLSEATNAELQIGAAMIGIEGYNEEVITTSKRNELIRLIQNHHYFNITVDMHSRVMSPRQIIDIDNCILV